MEKGSKAKYIGETNWAYTHGQIYEVEGFDRELDAWGIRSDNDEIYAVGEEDLEEMEG